MSDARLPPTLSRSELTDLFPGKPAVVLAFDALFRTNRGNTQSVTAGTDATQQLQDATAITLSSNEALTNERILAVDPASMTIVDNGPGNTVVLALLYPIALNGGYPLSFNLEADTYVDLPSSGRVCTSTLDNYANDAAAAAGGVRVGEFYRNGGVVMIRTV